VLRLREAPRSVQTALVGCTEFSDVTQLLKHMDAALGGGLSAFEVMWNEFYRLVTTPPAKGSPPIGQDHAYYVLIEASGGDASRDQARFEEALGEAIERGVVADAVISSSEAQRESLWALRDDVESVFRCGMPVGFDVSLPVTEMEGYVSEIIATLERDWPAYRRFVFGHLGDGNLHIIAAGPASREAKAGIERCVYEPLAARGGSVSAEHGIGLEKQPWLGLSRTDAELELMRRLKTALDPRGILNPGRVLPT
jgi:FAD/FMN-containing dehydrogenase